MTGGRHQDAVRAGVFFEKGRSQSRTGGAWSGIYPRLKTSNPSSDPWKFSRSFFWCSSLFLCSRNHHIFPRIHPTFSRSFPPKPAPYPCVPDIFHTPSCIFETLATYCRPLSLCPRPHPVHSRPHPTWPRPLPHGSDLIPLVPVSSYISQTFLLTIQTLLVFQTLPHVQDPFPIPTHSAECCPLP